MRARRYPFSMELVVAVVAPCVLLTGCYNWYSIKPGELTKLSKLTVGVVKAGPGAGQAVAVGTTKVERTDGRLLEVKGNPRIRITANGQTLYFNPPITVEPRGNGIVVKSGNRAATFFAAPDIQKVEVRGGLSATFWIVYVLLTIALCAIAIAVPLALI